MSCSSLRRSLAVARSSFAWLLAGAALLGVACGVESDRPAAGQTPATQGAEARSTEPEPVSQDGGVAAQRSLPGPEAREKLIGWWLRHDQSYMIVIDKIGEDGTVEARYLNPEPVHISKAETWFEDGFLRLLLELTDRNYPGNYYELAYTADKDTWIGLYHHLGNGETYEVYFTRFENEEDEP